VYRFDVIEKNCTFFWSFDKKRLLIYNKILKKVCKKVIYNYMFSGDIINLSNQNRICNYRGDTMKTSRSGKRTKKSGSTVRFGNMIRRKRKEMGYSAEKFAEMCQRSSRTISDIENGYEEPRFGTVMILCKNGKVDAGELKQFYPRSDPELERYQYWRRKSGKSK